MAADVRLDDYADGWVTVEANVLRVTGADLMIDSQGRRDGAGGSYRRALVHGPGDTLIVNWANDYTGGVVLNNARFRVLTSEGEPQLPKDGEIGQLVVTVSTNSIGGQVVSETVTLWVCIGVPRTGARVRGSAVQWLPVQTGEAVTGTV